MISHIIPSMQNWFFFAFLLPSLAVTGLHAAKEGQPISRLAFGSCADQETAQPIWEIILKTNPQLFILLGDNIYADTTDMKVMKAKYDRFGQMPGFRKLRKICSVLATWDDHDYGQNDAGVEFPKKRESQQLFLDFFQVSKDSPRRQQEGVYSAQIFGPPGRQVQIILLDMRYFRSPLKVHGESEGDPVFYDPDPDPSKTFLGPAQWRWLAEQLLMPAQVRIIGSSMQVVAEDHKLEKWMNLPKERRHLFQILQDSRATGVIFVSGDRHFGELSMMDAGLGYPIYDLTSSSLNRVGHAGKPLEPNQHRLGLMYTGDNFGLITIDWIFSDPKITLQIHDGSGEIRLLRKILLSDLKPASKPSP